jgi:hypothetical protein
LQVHSGLHLFSGVHWQLSPHLQFGPQLQVAGFGLCEQWHWDIKKMIWSLLFLRISYHWKPYRLFAVFIWSVLTNS